MRQAKLSELIHSSKNVLLDNCSVEIYFQEIEENVQINVECK